VKGRVLGEMGGSAVTYVTSSKGCCPLPLRAASFTWTSGRGLGPGHLNFFGPQMELAYRLDDIYSAQNNLDFQGPTPFHLPL
jgi:hypothetical protein